MEQLKSRDGIQKNKDSPVPRLIKVIRGSGNKSNKNNNAKSNEKFNSNFTDGK